MTGPRDDAGRAYLIAADGLGGGNSTRVIEKMKKRQRERQKAGMRPRFLTALIRPLISPKEQSAIDKRIRKRKRFASEHRAGRRNTGGETNAFDHLINQTRPTRGARIKEIKDDTIPKTN